MTRRREIGRTKAPIAPAAGEAASGSPQTRDWVFAAVLLAAIVLAYQPAWQGGLLWDDDAHVTAAELRSWQGLGRIWLELGATQQYYPMLHSVFWIEHRLWGDATLGYHLANILLQWAAALLVAGILRRLAVPGAWLAAAIFALHPVQVESVAWITEQKNTLSTVFYLAAAATYLRFDQTRRATPYVAALALFLLALLSKSVTATLPAALLVVFWWQRGRLSWRRDVGPLVPLFVVGVAAGLFTAWVERTFIGAQGAEFALTPLERCLVAGRAFWFYLGKLFWPCPLVFIYPRWQVSQTVWWQYLFPAAAALLLACVWGLRRRWRGPLAALLFFAGTLLPALGFQNVYPFRFSFVADHFQYLASLGIIVLVSAGGVMLLERLEFRYRGRSRLPAGQMLALALLATLAGLTWRQARKYSDMETLYRTTIDAHPDCFLFQNNLASILAGRGEVAEAMAHCQRALQAKPDYAEAHYNFGVILADCGRLDEALEQYQQAVRIKPGYAQARNNLGVVLTRCRRFDEAIEQFQQVLRSNPDHAEIRYNLGSSLAGAGRLDEAIAQFQEAVKINPGDAKVHNNLGNALAGRGRWDEAIAQYQQAVAIAPEHAEAHNNLGNALVARGRADEAIAQYQAALKSRPDYAEARSNLGNALAAQGHWEEAIAQYQKALESRPQDARAHNNLANALIGSGRLDEAIAQCREALRINPAYVEAHYNLGVALAGSRREEQAIAEFQEVLKLKPDDVEARNQLQAILDRQERK